MTFTEKQKLAEECNEWLTENNISPTPFNVITFLDCKGMINNDLLEDADVDDIKMEDPFDRAIIDWVYKIPTGNPVLQTIRAIIAVATPLIFGVLIAGMIISIIKTGGQL